MKVFSMAVLMACLAVPAAAHHSGAGVDRTKQVTVQGIVKEFRWTNPHSWIDLQVVNAKGVSELWSVEMNPPPFLIRAGWRASSLKPGDEVKVTLNPMRDGTPGGIFVSVTLADGKVLGGRAGGAPAAPPTAK